MSDSRECRPIDLTPPKRRLAAPVRLWNAIRKSTDHFLQRRRFAQFGDGSRVSERVRVIGPKQVRVGCRVLLQEGVRIEAIAPSGVVCVEIGDGTSLRPYVSIAAAVKVTIGRDCGIGSFTHITDHEHDISDPSQPIVTHLRVLATPTVIGAGVFIGERSAIMRGVRIGDGAIIGANSVVNRDIPAYCMAVGAPARVIKRWNPDTASWERFDG